MSAKTMSLRTKQQQFIRQYSLYVSPASRASLLDPIGTCVSLSSITFVVLAACLLFTALQVTPFLFLSLAEMDVGQQDLVLNPIQASNAERLNYTFMKDISISGCMTPRFDLINNVQIISPLLCRGYDPTYPRNVQMFYQGPAVDWDPNNNTIRTCQDSTYDCLTTLCGENSFTSTRLLFIDTNQEKQCQIGTSWNVGTIEPGKVVLHASLADQLKVSIGDSVLLILYPWDLSGVLHDYATSVAMNYTNSDFSVSYLIRSFTIQNLIDDSVLFSLLGDVSPQIAFLEFSNLIDDVWQLPPLQEYLYYQQVINTTSAYDIAQKVLVSPLNRDEFYKTNDFSGLAKRFIEWSEDVLLQLGYYRLGTNIPLLNSLKQSQTLSSFMQLLVNLILLLVSAMSIFLVQSLMTTRVEQKTMDFSIYRMLGFQRRNVVSFILCQSLIYSLPSWLIGVSLAHLVLFLGVKYFNITSIPVALSTDAWWSSLIFGWMIPLIASILPVQLALRKSIIPSKSSSSLKITLTKGENLLPLFLIGCLLSSVGVLIYYGLPSALVSMNFALLFNIFLILLLGMFIGWILLSLNLQKLFNFLLVALLERVFLFEKKFIFLLMRNHFKVYTTRFQSISLMFALSVGMVLFLSTATRIEVSSLVYSTTRSQGTAIQVARWDKWGNVLQSIENVGELENLCYNNALNVSCNVAWQSYSLGDAVSSVQLMNLGMTYSIKANVFAVSSNFFSVLFQEYFTLSDSEYLNGDEAWKAANSPKNYMIVPESLKLTLNTQLNEDMIMMVTLSSPGSTTLPTINVYPIEPCTFLSNIPGALTFGSFPLSDSVDVLVPATTYLDWGGFESLESLPIRYGYFSLNTTNDTLINTFVQQMTQYVPSYRITTLSRSLSGLGSLPKYLTIGFQCLLVLVMFLAIFMLQSNASIHILEQKQSLAILLALGVTKWTLQRIIIYEYFLLLLSSACLGAGMGVLVGWSFAAQRALFTRLPLTLSVDGVLLVEMVAICAFCAVIATMGPLKLLLKKPLSVLLK